MDPVRHFGVVKVDMVSIRAFLIGCLCLVAAGCRSASTETLQDSNVSPSQKMDNPPGSSVPPVNTRGKRPGQVTDNRPPVPPVPPVNSHGGQSKPPVNNTPSRDFDASEFPIPLAPKAQECAGSFLDSNKHKLTKVSVQFRQISTGRSDAQLTLTLRCAYSAFIHKSNKPANSKFSCRDIQKAIASVAVCDSRTEVGDMNELMNRARQVFQLPMNAGNASNGRFDGTNDCSVSVSYPQAMLVFQKTPDSERLGDSSYRIVYDFSDISIIFREYYHSTSVPDILCPIGVHLDQVKTKRNSLSAVGTSLMNAIKDH